MVPASRSLYNPEQGVGGGGGEEAQRSREKLEGRHLSLWGYQGGFPEVVTAEVGAED